MITIIAEKPSVARDIAKLLNAIQKQDGYLEGNGYAVTWAFGHLVTLAMPDDYGITGYNKSDLPIIPNPFQLKIREIRSGKEYKTDPSAKKQIGIIDKLFKQSDKIIVATDAGREGELIFRYIYEYLNCKTPFDRLWISSLTDKAIEEGMSNLQDGNKYDPLYLAGKARSEADWLVGINASRALAASAQMGGYSLGRVQTPTLAMICKRFIENKDFKTVPYWKIRLQTEKDGIAVNAVSQSQFDDLKSAKELVSKIKETSSVNVQSVETKEVKTAPPLLHDLTSLQKDANKKFGYSADKTLSIAQSLYESKHITYPRTGSRYITDDVLDEIPALISLFEDDAQLANHAKYLSGKSLNTHSVNADKVTDHHALLPTENIPNGLKSEEENIYRMVAVRMLEAFSDVSIKEVTNISLQVADETFSLKGETSIELGWKAVLNDKSSDSDDVQNLPSFDNGEQLVIQSVETTEHKTKPKPLFTEAGLLSAMENAGRIVEDKEAQSAMKECGIGTPATRASIIETLLTRNYIERSKKNLVPTEKGLQVYELVKDRQIANPQMTGEWENAMEQIEHGKISAEDFNSSIKDYAKRITDELLQLKIVRKEGELHKCPRCKQKSLQLYPKVAKCSSDDCDFILFRTVCKKQLSDKEVLTLVKTGKSPLLKNLKSKAGKNFDAYLVLQDDSKTTFEFPQKKKS